MQVRDGEGVPNLRCGTSLPDNGASAQTHPVNEPQLFNLRLLAQARRQRHPGRPAELLLVFDLNGTLLHRPKGSIEQMGSGTKLLHEHASEGSSALVRTGSRPMLLRPHLSALLASCFGGRRGDVVNETGRKIAPAARRCELCAAVWTSAMERNM